MAKIRVNEEELLENGSSMEKKISELQALLTRLNALIERIEASWDGDASTAYINTMRGYATQAEAMIQVLTEFKTYVNSASSLFKNTDGSAAAKIRGSF